MANECGSASLSWYAERCTSSSRTCSIEAWRSTCRETDGASSASRDGPQRDVHLLGRRGRAGSADERQQGGLEAVLQRPPQPQQGRIPLPAVVDAVEAAEVQLVAAVQRQLQVVVAERVGGGREGHVELGLARRVGQRGEDRGRQGAARLGEDRHDGRSTQPASLSHPRRLARCQAGQRMGVRLLAPPGVYRPLLDSQMLAEALRDAGLCDRKDLLDLGTGSGVVAISGARLGARATAVDVSRRAVMTAHVNARLNGVRVRALRGSLFDPGGRGALRLHRLQPALRAGGVPRAPTRGPARAWDAGPATAGSSPRRHPRRGARPPSSPRSARRSSASPSRTSSPGSCAAGHACRLPRPAAPGRPGRRRRLQPRRTGPRLRDRRDAGDAPPPHPACPSGSEHVLTLRYARDLSRPDRPRIGLSQMHVSRILPGRSAARRRRLAFRAPQRRPRWKTTPTTPSSAAGCAVIPWRSPSSARSIVTAALCVGLWNKRHDFADAFRSASASTLGLPFSLR